MSFNAHTKSGGYLVEAGETPMDTLLATIEEMVAFSAWDRRVWKPALQLRARLPKGAVRRPTHPGRPRPAQPAVAGPGRRC